MILSSSLVFSLTSLLVLSSIIFLTIETALLKPAIVDEKVVSGSIKLPPG